MKKLISIIVPVYNVEEYVGMCIESVCNQTYRNLEIILVDDGSTDRSGDICDAYARRDERIRVIHKENGGLSDARNAGMEVASGEYISFIDSDDWIDSNMYEVLEDYAEQEMLDVMSCQLCAEIENKKPDNNIAAPRNFRVMSSDELLQHTVMAYENSVCNRLFRKKLIENLRFPVGRCYEDMLFTLRALLRTRRGGYVDNAFYHYRTRSTSIIGNRLSEDLAQNVLDDLLPFMKEKAQILYDSGKKELGDECTFQYLYEILGILSKIQNQTGRKENYKELKQEVLTYRKWMKEYVRSTAAMRKKVILILEMYLTDGYVRMRNMKGKRN